MKLTKRELLQFTPKKIKTQGSYSFSEDDRSFYCKCLPQWRIGEWPNNCRSCGRRIRVWTAIL